MIDPGTIYLYRLQNIDRYKTEWEKLPTIKQSGDANYYYYESESQGFSYFGIRGDIQINQSNQSIGQNISKPPDETTSTTKPNKEKPALSFPKITFPKINWLIVIPILLLIVIIPVFFLNYQNRFSVTTDKKLEDLKFYVERCKADGISSMQIREKLISVGWPKYIIDLILHDVHVEKNTDKILEYVKYMKAQEKSNEEIKNNLEKAGWPEELINGALKVI
jgi:hypothetical protein